MSEASTTPADKKNENKKQVSQSYWSLVWWKFRRNRLAVIGAIILAIYYITCLILPEFFAPYSISTISNIIEKYM